jgi:hypothetical protein
MGNETVCHQKQMSGWQTTAGFTNDIVERLENGDIAAHKNTDFIEG